MIALGSLLVASEARAMTYAPMCDEAGASVVAPIPALPNATGELRTTSSCDHSGETLSVTPPGHQRTSLERAFDPGERMLGALFAMAPPPSRVMPVADPDRCPAASEHCDSIYRPPRI